MSDTTNKIGTWTQTLLAVGSLVFGVGMLYGDVQDIKRQVSQNGDLTAQTQVLRAELNNTQESQKATLKVLEKLTDTVDRLNTSVAKLEVRVNK
ncbi:hypothetical protein D3C77_37810 [compost metagenome]